MIRCAYPFDGNSMGMGNEGCGGRSFPVTNFKGMMEQHACCPQSSHGKCAPYASADDRWGCQYNEVVINGYTWKHHLPHVIESVFFPVSCPVKRWEGDRNKAVDIRDQFIKKFGLGRDDVPVLSFSCAEARAGRAPFKHVA